MSIRAFAAFAALSFLSLSGGAHAQAAKKAAAPPAAPVFVTWTDSLNRVSFDHPKGWEAAVKESNAEGFAYVIVGTADAECEVFVLPSPNTANVPFAKVFSGYQNLTFGVDEWQKALADFSLYKGKGVVEETSETPGPVVARRAKIKADYGQPAYALMTGRPGVQLFQFCTSYDGKNRAALFETILASIRFTKDPEWQAELAAAAAAAAAPPAPEPKPDGKKKR